MAVTHIAGIPITIDDRYLRQRCGWCGDVLLDYDLERIAMPVGPGEAPSGPATWEPGKLIRRDGAMSSVVEEDRLPDDACSSVHPDLTR